MEKNLNLYGIKGLLTLYTTVLSFSTFISFISIVFLFLKPDIVFSKEVVMGLSIIIVNIIATVTLLKLSPKAIFWNKLSIFLGFISLIYSSNKLISAYNNGSEMPLPIYNFLFFITVVVPCIFYIFYFVYWFVSKRVKNTFIGAQNVNQNNNINIVNNTNGINTGLNNNLNNAQNIQSNQINNPYYHIHTMIFSVLTITSSFVFLYTGLAALGLVPFAIIFSLVYVSIQVNIFNKNKTNAYQIYSQLITGLTSYISLCINFGIMSDSENMGHIITSILGIPSAPFLHLFSTLLSFTFYYFVISLVIYNLFVKKKLNKVIAFIIPVIGITLIGIHIGKVLYDAPSLKKEVQIKIQKIKNEEQRQIDETYSFDSKKIFDNTFTNRLYSIFTPPELPGNIELKDCVYTSNTIMEMMKQIKFAKSVDFECLDYNIKNKLPLTLNEPIYFSLPTKNWMKRGDIFVFVAELPKESFLWINMVGNAAKDCACRMSPYDYSGVKEQIKIGSEQIYERSLVQKSIDDKKRTVMVMYPINVSGIKTVDFKLSQFSSNPNIPVKLIEVGVIRSNQTEPQWLKDWLKLPNPFLGK